MALTVPVGRIQTEARQLDPVKVLLTLIAVIPFALGWVAGKTWMAFAWLLVAVRVGWQQARDPGAEEGESG